MARWNRDEFEALATHIGQGSVSDISYFQFE